MNFVYKMLLLANVLCATFMAVSAIFLDGRYVFEAAIGAIASLLSAAAVLYKDKLDPEFPARQRLLFKAIGLFTVLGWIAILTSPETFGMMF